MNANQNQVRKVFSYILFPFILGTNISVLIIAITKNWELESTFSYMLLGNIAGMFLLEKIWFFKKEWNTNFAEFIRDFGYFGFNGLIDTGVKLGLGYLVISYASPTQFLPLWVSVILAVLAVEFFGYWYHRIGHVNHFLWKIHSIHHVPDKVNLLNNNTANFLNIVFGTAIKLLPLILLGFCKEAVFIATSLTTVHSYVVHVNTDIKGGWLNAIFMSPEHHRMHHSTVIQEAKNFAVLLTVWDKIFGTYVYYDGMVPKEVGVQNPEKYPKPFEVVKGFLFPFTSKRLW